MPEFNLEKWLEIEKMRWFNQDQATIAASSCLKGFNKALDLMREEATENGWRGVECCSDKGLYVPLDILEQIINKLKGVKPVNKFSQEYYESFKQAQKDMPNIEKYFGEEKE